MLLRQLYRDTPTALEGGLETLNRETPRGRGQARPARRAGRLGPGATCAPRPPATTRPTGRACRPTRRRSLPACCGACGDDEIRIDLHPDADRDATRACFALADHPGIFSRLAGALALVGANVVDARTYTSKDGYATAVFWVQDAEGNPYEVVAPAAPARDDRQDAEGRGRGARGAEGPRQGQEARTRVPLSRPTSPSTTKAPRSTRSSRSTPATAPACCMT